MFEVDLSFDVRLPKFMFKLWVKQIVASYFPVGQCIEALRIMCLSLFGATFEQVPLAPGEAWHPAVQKMSLRHSSEVFQCVTSPSEPDV